MDKTSFGLSGTMSTSGKRSIGAERSAGMRGHSQAGQEMLLSVGALFCTAYRTARGYFRRNECAELESKACVQCWILAYPWRARGFELA